jgi:hypothetical protein
MRWRACGLLPCGSGGGVFAPIERTVLARQLHLACCRDVILEERHGKRWGVRLQSTYAPSVFPGNPPVCCSGSVAGRDSQRPCCGVSTTTSGCGGQHSASGGCSFGVAVGRGCWQLQLRLGRWVSALRAVRECRPNRRAQHPCHWYAADCLLPYVMLYLLVDARAARTRCDPLVLFVLVWRMLRAAHVTTGAGTLSTTGTDMVDIQGEHLGLNSSTVSISFSGGSTGFRVRSYRPSPNECFVIAAGTHVRCFTAPGVGANFSFVVTVDGGASPPSRDTLSFARPSVSEVFGPGATHPPTDGNGVVFLRGANLGAADSGAAVRAWAVPAADQTLAFTARECVIEVPHVILRCLTGAVMGASLLWRVEVEGQSDVLPLIAAVAQPVLVSATMSEASASTTGGTLVLLQGENLGNGVDHTRVSVTTRGGTADMDACVLLTDHKLLQCALPAGTGPISRISVAVLGQTGVLEREGVSGLSYRKPSVTAVFPAKWPTDVSSLFVTVTGSGFGSSAQSNLVSVSATAVDQGCPIMADVAAGLSLTGTKVLVVNDSTMSFVLETSPGHVVPAWVVTVVVAGQSSEPAAASRVTTRSPGISFISAVSDGASGLSTFLLTGTNLGPAVSACADDAVVTVGGHACFEQVMTQVRAAPHTFLAHAACPHVVGACRFVVCVERGGDYQHAARSMFHVGPASSLLKRLTPRSGAPCPRLSVMVSSWCLLRLVTSGRFALLGLTCRTTTVNVVRLACGATL